LRLGAGDSNLGVPDLVGVLSWGVWGEDSDDARRRCRRSVPPPHTPGRHEGRAPPTFEGGAGAATCA